MSSIQSFVRNYALNNYTFKNDPESFLVGKLIHTYAHGKRVLNLGCGPITPITSLFYPNAKESVEVDRLKENLDFVKKHANELDSIVKRALSYKHRFLSKNDAHTKIRLHQGDVTKRLPLGKFDSVMQIGCFAALDNKKQFQQAVNHTYDYLKKGGTLLMVNWMDERSKVKRPYHFNGAVNAREVFIPSMQEAGYKIKEVHTTSNLHPKTKKMGYTGIIWAVAKK